MMYQIRRSLLDRVCGWMHTRLHYTVKMKHQHVKLFHIGYQTEFAGKGRALQLSFFGGAGYVWWDRTHTYVVVPGFTITIRLRQASRPSSLVSLHGAQHWPLLSVTRRPGRYYF